MQHRISSGMIVERGGRLLLVRHVKPGAYDFWVAPGGGVQGTESLADAARREVREETGLTVEPQQLAYIEELAGPKTRHCKFWFIGTYFEGELSVAAPEAQSEFIVEAAWLSRPELKGKIVFPPVLEGRYWQDRQSDRHVLPVHLPLRHMEFS
jgi:ADP-ribose pyrophosphatase YjhB (NUDIX family)